MSERPKLSYARALPMTAMATLRVSFLSELLGGRSRDDHAKTNSRAARKFAHEVYKETGVTPELRRVYGEYLKNEHRRKTRSSGE